MSFNDSLLTVGTEERDIINNKEPNTAKQANTVLASMIMEVDTSASQMEEEEEEGETTTTTTVTVDMGDLEAFDAGSTPLMFKSSLGQSSSSPSPNLKNISDAMAELHGERANAERGGDVRLFSAAGGRFVRAHRVVLAAVSPMFRKVFEDADPCHSRDLDVSMPDIKVRSEALPAVKRSQ